MVAKNLHRRHLGESKRAALANKIATMKLGSNRHETKTRSADLRTIPPSVT